VTAIIFTTAMNAPYEALVQAGVLAGLEGVAALKPAKLVVVHRLRTAHRAAVDARNHKRQKPLDLESRGLHLR